MKSKIWDYSLCYFFLSLFFSVLFSEMLSLLLENKIHIFTLSCIHLAKRLPAAASSWRRSLEPADFSTQVTFHCQYTEKKKQ